MPEAQGQAPVAADPVTAIQAMLDAEDAPPAEASPPADAQPAADAPAEEQAPPAENAVVEGEDAPADVPVAEIPVDQLEAIQLEVTTKGEDGKDVVEKPTIKELREGYMRQKDYSRKTAEVARQREEVGEKVRQAIDSERAVYQQNLTALQSAFVESVAPEFKDINWNQLATNDPAEYVRLRNRADQIQNVLATIDAKQKEVSLRQTAERGQATKKAAAEARTTLEAKIPNWNDNLYHELMQTGEAYGFKPEEVGSWVDARAIQVLHDAHQYRLLKTKPASRAAIPPKVIKPGASAAIPRAQAQASEAMKRLQSSGSINDAVDVIASRL